MEGLKFINFQKGQTLVEVIIALALATVAITALLTTVLSSLNNTEDSQSQNEATQYSQQGLEVLRSMVKLPDLGDHCLGSNNDVNENTCVAPNIDGKYIRKVSIENGNPTCGDNTLRHVTVSTSWNNGDCGGTYCKSSKLESCMSNI